MSHTERTPSGSLWRVGRWARQRVDAKAMLATVVTIGLLGYVSALAVSPQGGGQIWGIIERTWWIVALLSPPYIWARLVLWHELLEQLHILVPWRPTLAALAGGEIAKTVPGGIYVQNYILARLGSLGELAIVRSSLATTATLGLESVIALPVALVVGIRDTPWLSWTILGIVALWLLLLIVLRILVHHWRIHLAPGIPTWLRHGMLLADEFLEAGVELVTWRTARALVPTAMYMLIEAAELYLMALAVGVQTMSFTESLGIYAVIVLSIILVPIPTKLGPTELTGLTAFVAYGIPGPTAAIIMLGWRLLTTGLRMLVAMAILVILRGVFTANESVGPPG